MIVPIVSANESAPNPPEWAMLELNGELIVPAVLPDGQQNDENQDELLGPDRVELGSLRFTDEGMPIMVLGSHELKGEMVTLKESFCVMKKRKRENNYVDYKVVGVVTKKLLFSHYPKSIVR